MSLGSAIYARAARDNGPDIAGDARPSARAAPLILYRTAPRIAVERADPARYWTLRDSVHDLAARAAWPNPFAEPGIVAAAAEANPGVVILLAWAEPADRSPPVLVGAWPLVERRGWLPPFRSLTTKLHPMAYAGSPVIDAAQGVAVLRSFFAFARTGGLPRIIGLFDLYADDEHRGVLEEALRAEGIAVEPLDRRRRAQLRSPLDGRAYLAATLSPQTRRKLNQKWKRLETEGNVQEDFCRDQPAVFHALEEILALEQAGWKGQRCERGRAVLSDVRKANFLRGAVRRLAADDRVACHAIRLNGRMVAGQILIYSGRGAVTWLTTYDETLSRCSPGILLLKLTTGRLLDDPDVTFVDSCNPVDVGYMADMWKDHVTIVDLAIDLGPSRGVSLRLFAAWQRGCRRSLKTLRKLYHRVKRFRAVHPAA